jgi:hypothetical protein
VYENQRELIAARGEVRRAYPICGRASIGAKLNLELARSLNRTRIVGDVMKSIRGTCFSAWQLFLAIAFALSFSSRADTATEVTQPKSSSADADANQLAILPGTILPIRLGSLSSEKRKPGDPIKARIMQDVPLGNGSKLRAGSTVLGRIVEVTPAGSGKNATLTLRFDTVVQGKTSIPVLTNVRAMASALEVEFAQTPTTGPGESDVYDWLTTVQVGGEVVGRSTYDGVLARVNASRDAKCRGPVEGNDRPQAFWVFSSDACGAYGFPTLTISHFGRSVPRGEIVLVSERGPVKIRSGSGMLLCVQR